MKLKIITALPCAAYIKRDEMKKCQKKLRNVLIYIVKIRETKNVICKISSQKKVEREKLKLSP